MRLALTSLLIALAGVAWTQTNENLFTSTKPDVSIVVRQLPNGADSVEVTMMEQNYPPELLQNQVLRVGEALGQPAGAIQIERNKIDNRPDLTYLQGIFAVRGLINRATGVLRVEPFAKAFAGAPEPHQVDVLMVRFEGERPNANTLRLYNPKGGAVKLQAVPLTNPDGVEYRVQLLAQDPAKIQIPDDRSQSTQPKANATPKSNGPDFIFIGSLVTAALALGALVYSILLRARPKESRSRRA